MQFFLFVAQTTGNDYNKRHMSLSDTSQIPESNVVRKVASLTILEKNNISETITKPKFVPEKLDFKIYEKFEGKFLPFRSILFRSNSDIILIFVQ